MVRALRKSLAFQTVRGLLLPMICGMVLSRTGLAQKAVPVPKLDLEHYVAAWHVQAWMPSKAEKRCTTNVVILYAVGDKPDSFQMGTFCRVKNGSTEEWSARGKQEKGGSGKLKLRKLILFSSPLWVLDVDPDYTWALVGTPNHKRLWVLSKAATMSPELLSEIQNKASAQGFNTAKLSKTVQSDQAL